MKLIDFGDRVKEVRKKLYLRQNEFAVNIGISGSFLSEIEAGKTRAGFDFFYNITEKYLVNPTYLLHGKGEMFLNPDYKPSVDYGPDSDIIQHMLENFRKLPVVRFAVLGFYKNYLYDKHDMLKQELEKQKESKDTSADFA